MSTANLVPETWELTGDDARRALAHTGRRRLLADAFVRLRVADGFSHARSLAFMTSLVAVEGVIALVGVASALGDEGFGNVIVRSIRTAAPGPAGVVLTTAVDQARQTGASHNVVPIVLGTLGALVAATTAFGQVERALNRIYGVEQDRPTVQKYGLALVLALSAGTLTALAFGAVAFSEAVSDSIGAGSLRTAWGLARWPVVLVLLAGSWALLLRWCPRRHQPGWSWLVFGSAVSIGLWLLVTAGLGAFFRASTSFGDTYGPLAGMVALLLWALASATVLLYGAAVAAQLEAVRAHAATPQDRSKAARSSPDSRRTAA
ncbi:MAG: YihY/virulence factor BrkB family protein [Acidobacteria bacterium]|nr:YihY/virulence factor BrkB family protein [Acidobacteriota bacterium]